MEDNPAKLHTVTTVSSSGRNSSDSGHVIVPHGPKADISSEKYPDFGKASQVKVKDTNTHDTNDEAGRPWKPTLIRLGPLAGILAMCLALSCILASLGILMGSNGVSVEHWTVQPSEYLAVFTAIANLATR